jgi:hypothetical protein
MMKRLTQFACVAAILLSGSAGYAQDDTGAGTAADPKINTVIIFGEDDCPESTDEQINVCAILVEADRYRIPPALRNDPNDPKNQSWAQRVIGYRYVGRDGNMSCSASGAGGFAGCGLKAIDQAYEEKAVDPGIVFGRLIAEERKKRLAGIDAEAEEVEKRVVQFEKERAEREARLQQQDEAASDAEALPSPE